MISPSGPCNDFLGQPQADQVSGHCSPQFRLLNGAPSKGVLRSKKLSKEVLRSPHVHWLQLMCQRQLLQVPVKPLHHWLPVLYRTYPSAWKDAGKCPVLVIFTMWVWMSPGTT